MPIFEYHCRTCGRTCELIVGPSEIPVCRHCSSRDMEKLLSAPAAASGPASQRMPGPGDTACCGSSPGEAANCAGPGSCCGRALP